MAMLLCRQAADHTRTVSIWTMYQGCCPGASIPRSLPPALEGHRVLVLQAEHQVARPYPEPGPEWQSQTRTRTHLTLALSTPIPKLMVATITGTFSSIHSFCTSVLSGAFSPRTERVRNREGASLVGFPWGLPAHTL